jgi:hypothetical protein
MAWMAAKERMPPKGLRKEQKRKPPQDLAAAALGTRDERMFLEKITPGKTA